MNSPNVAFRILYRHKLNDIDRHEEIVRILTYLHAIMPG